MVILVFIKVLNFEIINKNKILLILYILVMPIIFYDLIFKKIDKTHIEFNKNKKKFKIKKYYQIIFLVSFNFNLFAISTA